MRKSPQATGTRYRQVGGKGVTWVRMGRERVVLLHSDTRVARVGTALVASGNGRPIQKVTRLENFGECDVAGHIAEQPVPR